MANRQLHCLSEQAVSILVYDERSRLEEVDALYQTPGSGEHTFYVATKRPKGRWMKLFDQLVIAGSGSNQDCSRNLERFLFGGKRWLVFERDNMNVADPNAIKVIGVWEPKRTSSVEQGWLGWVSRDDNQSICEYMRIGTIIGTPKVFLWKRVPRASI
jgi:hypothetical protein